MMISRVAQHQHLIKTIMEFREQVASISVETSMGTPVLSTKKNSKTATHAWMHIGRPIADGPKVGPPQNPVAPDACQHSKTLQTGQPISSFNPEDHTDVSFLVKGGNGRGVMPAWWTCRMCGRRWERLDDNEFADLLLELSAIAEAEFQMVTEPDL